MGFLYFKILVSKYDFSHLQIPVITLENPFPFVAICFISFHHKISFLVVFYLFCESYAFRTQNEKNVS